MVDFAYQDVIAQRLKFARKLRGLTQLQAGRVLGVSTQQWQKYESGTNRISADALGRFANELQLPISYFFLPPRTTSGFQESMSEYEGEMASYDILKLFQTIRAPELRQLLRLSAQVYNKLRL